MVAMSCAGCSRRELLHGLAVTTVTVIAGCTGDPNATVTPDAMTNPAVTMCGANLCIDLKAASNAVLTMVDGAMTVVAPHDRIIVICTAANSYVALSDVCTHAGCSVAYNKSNKDLQCPCHGSQYTLTGSVMRGPATRPLAKYQTMFDASTSVLTIVLA